MRRKQREQVKIKQNKIKQNKLIEMEIVAYPDVKKRCLELGDSAPPDFTEWLNQMDIALNQFCTSPEKYEFVRKKYWDIPISNERLSAELGISNYNVLLWRKELLGIVGQRIGMT